MNWCSIRWRAGLPDHVWTYAALDRAGRTAVLDLGVDRGIPLDDTIEFDERCVADAKAVVFKDLSQFVSPPSCVRCGIVSDSCAEASVLFEQVSVLAIGLKFPRPGIPEMAQGRPRWQLVRAPT